MEEERDSVQAEMVSHIRSQEREIVEGESQIVGKEIGFHLGKFWTISLSKFCHRIQADMEENFLRSEL